MKPSPDYAIGGQTPFRVNIQDRASSDNLEDNDTFATASNLGGIDIWGQGPLSIRTPDDVDFFKFTPLRTGFENIRLGYDPRFGDLNLALYDEARHEVARSTGNGNTEFLSFNGLANGRQYYYLKVWAEGAKIDLAFSPYYDLLFSPARTGPAVDLNWANQGGNEVRFPVARAGERREETATIINAGTETLELGQMTVPAGFEVLKHPASSLAPGQTDTVTVRAAYPATPGTWQSSLTFRTNDPERPVAAFSLTTPVAGVSGRQFLDNWNAKDNNTPNFSNQDLSAIDYAKQALLPGQRATVANVSNYAKGINGVLLSLVRTSQRALTAADFGFRYGTGSDSTTWSPLPTDNVNVVAKPFGYAGWSVAVIFPDYDSATAGRFSQAVANGWLEVTLKANDRTGLTAPDVSYYGSLIGDTGNSASDVVVNAFDVAAVRRHQRDTFPDWKYDINRDGAVNALDLGLVRANLNRRLEMITTPPASAAASGAAANHDDLAAFLA